jgi:imidazolonepropionase-like amidohydrolase
MARMGRNRDWLARLNRRFQCALWLTVSAQATAAQGQLFERELLIRDARILTMDGAVMDRGSILIKGEKIASVTSTAPKTSMLTRVVDASGKTITPGIIDAWSALGAMDRSTSSADPTSSAWDGFDRYARDAFREALAQGVTTLSIGSPGMKGITGTCTIVQLVPQTGGAAGAILEERAALTINLSSGASASERLETYHSVRSQFRDALKYRRALEDYEEDLKEYLEKLEERRKKDGGEEDESTGQEKPKGDKDEPEKKPRKKGKEEKEAGGDGKALSDDSPRAGGAPRGSTSWLTLLLPDDTPKIDEVSFAIDEVSSAADEDGDELEEGAVDPHQPRPRRRGRRGGATEGEKAGAEKKEEDKDKDKDELKKPDQPKPDRRSEALLRAIDRDISVRIRAERSADIENALALAEAFDLQLVIEGGTEAYLLADRLAVAEVPVVLGPVTRTHVYENNEYRRHIRRSSAALAEAGVKWTVGSGASSRSASRFVGLNAQLAAGHDARIGDWLEIVTVRAAQVLGIADRVGRIRRGARANLVIWSGRPGDPDARVEQVYVDGTLAYRAPEGDDAGGGS